VVLSHAVGRWVKGPAEELGWSLTVGREGLTRLPTDENTSSKGMYRGYGNYPPSRMGAPTKAPMAPLTCTNKARGYRLILDVSSLYGNIDTSPLSEDLRKSTSSAGLARESASPPPGLTDKKRVSFLDVFLDATDDWKDAIRPPCIRTRIFQDSPAKKGFCHVVRWP
jgi:hypothetical protein